MKYKAYLTVILAAILMVTAVLYPIVGFSLLAILAVFFALSHKINHMEVA